MSKKKKTYRRHHHQKQKQHDTRHNRQDMAKADWSTRDMAGAKARNEQRGFLSDDHIDEDNWDVQDWDDGAVKEVGDRGLDGHIAQQTTFFPLDRTSGHDDDRSGTDSILSAEGVHSSRLPQPDRARGLQKDNRVAHPGGLPGSHRPTPSLPSSGVPQAAAHLALNPIQHQKLINLITSKLAEEGYSQDHIAEALQQAAIRVQDPVTQLPGAEVRSQSPVSQSDLPPFAGVHQPSETSILLPHIQGPTPFVPQQDPVKKSLATRLANPGPSLPPPPSTMSPGILIPRNAGIKIRGRSPSPPLVDAPAADKSKIVVASQYLFQHDLEAAGMMDERDVVGRLEGIRVIEAGRRGLRMPMKTYATASVFFMRYRYHVATAGMDDEVASRYDFRDAALASLWLASKAEETPKKSKEILCAFRNTTLPPEEHLTPDDDVFENQAKLMINLERYLLEIVAFDFRARNCAELLAGLMVELGSDTSIVGVAMAVALDLYRTLAVLKQTRQTLALACVEMAARFVQAPYEIDKTLDEHLYERMGTSRQEVLETLFDLIELYLSHHAITSAGSRYTINDFMRVSTTLRNEMKARNFARYTYIQEPPPSTSPTTSPLHTDAKSTPTLMGTPQTPANRDIDRKEKKKPNPKDSDKIWVEERDIDLGKPISPPPSFLLASPGRSNGHATSSPTSPTSPTTAPDQINPDDPSQVKEIVRFVLDASRARDEDLLRRPFHAIETVEKTEQHTLYIPRDGSSESAEAEMLYTTTAPATPASPAQPTGSKLRYGTGDVDMKDAPPSGPRGGGFPPLGPRDARDDRERRDGGYRRRSPPPLGRRWDDRGHGRRDDRRW